MKTPRKIWPRVSAVGEVEPALEWKSLQVIRALICLLLFWALVVPVSAGDITGKVELSVKKPLKRSSNDTPKAKKNQRRLYGRRGLNFRVPGSDEDGGLTKKELAAVNELDHVLVYITRAADGAKLTATKKPVDLDQSQRMFKEHVTPVVKGSPLTFVNKDDFEHDIYTPRDGEFEVGRHGGGRAATKVAAKLGSHEIFCNIHTLMNAFIYVVPNDFYSRLENGRYTFKDVPPGTYKVRAWHPRIGQRTQTVTVGPEAQTVDFRL